MLRLTPVRLCELTSLVKVSCVYHGFQLCSGICGDELFHGHDRLLFA